MVIRAAVVAQAILLVYLQAIEWINLFPWNEVRHGNGQAKLDIAIGVLSAIVLFVTWRRWLWAMVLGLISFSGWLWLQIDGWWIPYFQGASLGWQRTYHRFFSETVRILPGDSTHLPPDACHFVPQLLIVAALATTLAACFRRRTA